MNRPALCTTIERRNFAILHSVRDALTRELEHLGLALCAWRQDLQSREDLSERALDRACATIESALHALRRLWREQPYHGWRPMSARPHMRATSKIV